MDQDAMTMLADTDIFVSVFGNDLCYLVYLAPDSAVISYTNVRNRYYNALAEVAGLKYYPVYNQSNHVFIHYGQLHNYLRLATAHIQIVKYKLPPSRRD